MEIVSIETILQDNHMQEVWLTYLSSKQGNKLEFARLLFLLNVQEYKKFFSSENSRFKTSVASILSYAQKLIVKYLATNAFMRIATAKQTALNKEIAKCIQIVRRQTDDEIIDPTYFDAVVSAVIEAMEPHFQKHFRHSTEYQDLLQYARLTYAPTKPTDNGKACLDSKKRKSTFTLEQLLQNGRMRSIFWVFVFSDRTHAELSCWMDIEYRIRPLIADANPKLFWESIRVLCRKYIQPGASVPVPLISDADRNLFDRFYALVAAQDEEDADRKQQVQDSLTEIQHFLLEQMRMNHFVRFLSSESSKLFRELACTYAKSNASAGPAIDEASGSEHSASSTCSLQEIMQDFQIVAHQTSASQNCPYSLANLHRLSSQESPVSVVVRFAMNIKRNGDGPTFKKKILFHADAQDGRPHELPDHYDQFIMPQGAELIRSQSRPDGQLFHLTLGTSDRTFYGAILIRYCHLLPEDMGPIEQALAAEEGFEVYYPVGLCLFSRFPIHGTLRNRLQSLHLDMLQDAIHRQMYYENVEWRPSAAQMEKLIGAWRLSSPYPAYCPQIMKQLDLKPVDFSMKDLFKCLKPCAIVRLFTAMLLERRVVLLSSAFSVLTSVAETLRALLSPLTWSHVYAPIIPKAMLECLECPTPFLFGLQSQAVLSTVHLDAVAQDLVVVDLDKGTIQTMEPWILPESKILAFERELRQVLEPPVSLNDSLPTSKYLAETLHQGIFAQDAVRVKFGEFVKELLSIEDEGVFIVADTWDEVVVVDEKRVLDQVVDARDRAFYKQFLKTQAFSQYIAHSHLRQ